MRKIFLISLAILSIIGNLYAQEKLPKPQGYINDFVGILPPQERLKLERLLLELEKKTTAQIAVVILGTIKPLDIETYAVKLFENWGIGQKGKDNGVLLLVALNDRKLRIEVGYGLEGAIPDILAKQIITNIIVPLFREENYSQGIINGTLAITKLVAKEYNVQLSSFEGLPAVSIPRKTPPLIGLFRLIFTLLFFLLIFGTRWGFLWWPLLLGGGYRGGSGYWYGSGGGFSGGFGGFGGGFSGGGGASGGW